MKVHKKTLITLLLWAVVTSIISVYHQWGVHFQIGKDLPKTLQTATFQDIQTQFSWIQNITWTLLNGPLNPSEFLLYQKFFSKPSSKFSIRIYQITYDKIKSLLNTIASSAPLHMILEDQQFMQIKNKNSNESWRKNPNISIISDKKIGTKYVHAKTIVGDHHAIIQTANFSYTSYFKNTEHFFLTTNQDIVKNLQLLFEKDWKAERITPQDIHPNIVFCNINCRGVIEYLLKSAKTSITIQTQYITDPTLQNILIDQFPLDLKIIVANTESNDRIEKLLGKNIVKRQKKSYIHDKSILIDNKILLVGSMNLSANSLDNNREIGILLIDPLLIQTFKSGFESNWKKL